MPKVKGIERDCTRVEHFYRILFSFSFFIKKACSVKRLTVEMDVVDPFIEDFMVFFFVCMFV